MSTHSIARAEFVSLGDDVRGYYAVPDGGGPFPGVLLYQEAFGINEYIQSEVKRLASAGYATIAPDLFRGKTYGYDDMATVFANLQTLTDDGMLVNVRAAKAFLDARPEVERAPYGAVGFCMGGRLAVLTAITLGDAIGAVASFYGGGIAPEEPRFFPLLCDRIPEATAPMLMVYGTDDQSIGPSEIGRVAEALARRRERFEISVYPNAMHGFASRDRAAVYRPEAAESAWDETLAFFERYLAS